MSPVSGAIFDEAYHKHGSAVEGSELVEVNFDGLVGPTHNYAGLSQGNLASARHANAVSHPKLAALQGLAKVRVLLEMGVPQAVLPPLVRPDLGVLRLLGFHGSDADVVAQSHRDGSSLLAAVHSSSAMWAANAATVSPSPDTINGKIHLTPANLLTQFHRSIEAAETAKMLRQIFSADCFVHHDPLPAADAFADEGAANHLRLCRDYGSPGLEIFLYGRDESARPARFPARQTKLACEAIVRRHGLAGHRVLILRQSPKAIDAGAFHNDVVAASNRNVLLVHRQAFAEAGAIDEIGFKFGQPLWTFVAEPEEISLADAVSTYLFNSQIVSLPDGSMSIIAPVECQQHAGVQQYLARVLAGDSPIKSVHYVDLRQSMNNGGGPACLRLRVVMPTAVAQPMLINPVTIDRLTEVVQKRYREQLRPTDLTDPKLIDEARVAVEEITTVLAYRQPL